MSPKRSCPVSRLGSNRRKLLLEPLESRLLLAVAPADISESQAEALADGLAGLATWAEGVEADAGQEAVVGLDEYDLMAQMLPVIGLSLGHVLDFGDVLDTGLVTPVEDYFNADDTPTTDELVTALEDLSATYGNLTITVDPLSVSGGLVSPPEGDELIFELVFEAERSTAPPISLGPQGEELGFAFADSITVDLDSTLELDFSFGLDLTDGLTPERAFFIRVDGFDIAADVPSTALATGDMNAGFYDAQLTAGTMALAADLAVNLLNPDGDGQDNITLEELTGTELSSLVSLVGAGTASAGLAVSAGPFGGFTPGESLTVGFSSTNPFQPPTLTFSTDFGELLNFANLSSYSMLGVFGQLGTWLDQLRGNSVVDIGLQLADGASLGDVLDLGGIIADPDTGLIGSLMVGDGESAVPSFDSAQELAVELATVLGLPPETIDARYDETTDELSYHVLIEGTFLDTVLPLGFDMDLSPLVNLQSSSAVDVDAEATLEFTLGVDLSELRAEMTAGSSAPSNGRLSADASFQLLIGGSGDGPVAVLVEKNETDNNNDLDDLVGDITTALAAAGLSGVVQTGRDGNRLTLALTGSGAIGLMVLNTEADDPTATELGFDDGQIAADTIVHHAFIEDASLWGSATASVPDVDAAADFGFLRVEVVDGAGSAEVSMAMQLKDPEDVDPGGRIFVMDLFGALAEDISSVVVGPNISGNLDVQLPMVVTPNPFGGDHPANPQLILSWPDITDPDALDIQFDDADLLLDFTELGEMDFVSAFGEVAGYIAGLEGISFLNEEIPVLNVSVAEIADYAAKFAELVQRFQADPSGSLQDLEGTIEKVFGDGEKGVDADVTMVEDNDVVRVDLMLEETISTHLPVNLDLATLGLEELGSLVEFGGSAQLSAEVGVAFELDFGIDISDYLAPTPFLYDTTSLGFTLKVAGTDINFSTAIGPLGAWIRNGGALIDGDGRPDTTEDRAFLGVTLVDQDKGDGKIFLDELGFDNAEFSFLGQVNVALPVFFPTESNLLGLIDLSIANLGDIENTTTFSVPDFAGYFEDFNILDNLGVVIDGIDFVLGGVQDVLDGEVFGVDLPIIGDSLSGAADFIGDIRTDFIGQLRARMNESLDDSASVIRLALYLAVGPDGLNLLMDNNESGTVTEEDITVTLIDRDEDGQEDDEVHVDMLLGKGATIVDTPIQFDIGVPALGLEVDGNVELGVGFAWQLAFGISRQEGFYLDTSKQNELSVGIEARIPDMKATGNLLFLQLDASDEDADSDPNNQYVDVDGDGKYPSVFSASLSVDLKDPIDTIPGTNDDQDKLTFGDLASGDWSFSELVDASIEGVAAVNLDLLLSYEGDSRFPSLGAELALGWTFSPGDKDLSGGVPSLAFDNVRLNAGEFISDFADSLLKSVREITDPLQPIVDFLTEPIPIISDLGFQTTPLQLAAALGYEEAADFVETIANVITAINTVPIVDDQLYIPLGSFDLGGADPRGQEDLEHVTPNPVGEQPDPVQELHEATEEGGEFFDYLRDELGISLPIIESPGNLFGLLLGQGADLFELELPELSLGFPFPLLKLGPLIPPIPLFVSFGGYIGASLDLTIGYDTYGFDKVRETGDWYDVFSGFYISDQVQPDGTDLPEGTLTGAIYAGVELSLVVASAGVSGGVALNLHADLNDPDQDGKIHLDEFLGNLNLGLLSTFNVSGSLTASLAAYVEVLFVRYEFPLVEVTLADFEITDSDIYQDRDSAKGGTRDLGVGPGLHVDGLSLETHDDIDWHRFELLRPDSVDVDIRHSAVHGDIDLQVYDGTGAVLLGESSTQNDREVVSLVGLPAGQYLIRVFGQRNNYMLVVEPNEASSTRVIYVNPANKEDRSDSYYTTAPGDDKYAGLLHRKPKATLGSVLDTYELGPNDLVVLDTGEHVPGVVIPAADQGATFVGTPAGSVLAGITLQNSDASVLHSLTFAGEGTGLTIAGDAEGNVIRECTFGEIGVGLRIDGTRPNLIVDNTFEGPCTTGIHVSPGVTSTVQGNDVSGCSTGVYTDSQVVDMYGNLIHENAVGVESLQGVIGPDNPPPVGTPGGKSMNEVYANEIGVLIPGEANGVIVRFTQVYNNTEVGIEQQGEQSQIIANEVFGNAIGIRGTNEIGPGQWAGALHNMIHGNQTGVLAEVGAEVRYNRIFENQTGVAVEGDTVVHHNLIYRNTAAGVLLDEAYNVDVVNNTILAGGGDGIRLASGTTATAIHNNIIKVTSGYALYVDEDSQFGYASDHNNLFTGGSGRVAFQGKDFADLLDWQVEAESDLHSIGYTTVSPTLDDPTFVNEAGDDYRLQSASTSIDAGDPRSDFNLEPGPNGNRINLGAYGNTPLATASASSWLRITHPNFYVDLVPSRTYAIQWESYNVPGAVDLDVDLVQEVTGTKYDVDTVPVSAGSTTFSPGDFVSGSTTDRYRIVLTPQDASGIVVASREPFSVPNILPSDANTFYVDDGSNADDEYTPTAIGNNRNTGTTVADPKVVIRPLVLSYAMASGDQVLVDTGSYTHAINLNLSGSLLGFDPRMNTVQRTLITGPTDAAKVALIDRANTNEGSKAFDLIDSDAMTLQNLSIEQAGIGVHVRHDSLDFTAEHLELAWHGQDGLRIEGGSHGGVLDYLTVHDNGRHGIFVDSLLDQITQSKVYTNAGIGMALRSVGSAIVQASEVYDNLTGIDVINPGTAMAAVGHDDLDEWFGNLVYENDEDGIFASGNVRVAGNTVAENGNVGIRLCDGADAVLNVVRQHVTGISAFGSASNVLENRSYENTDTGIEASFHSLLERNVTYSNDNIGVHVDRFDGLLEHNLVYEDGYAGIVVEGPGTGAQLINNTVYEPCADNEEEPSTTTTVELNWIWNIQMMQFIPFLDFPVTLEGSAKIEYGPPVGEIPGETFNLGEGGTVGSPTAEPVPPGQMWRINTELVELSLSSVGSTPVGPIEVTLSPSQPTLGQIAVQNTEGILTGQSRLTLWADFFLPKEEKMLAGWNEMMIGMQFIDPSVSPFGEYDALQAPLWPTTFSGPQFLLGDEEEWGQWMLWEGYPEEPLPPQDPGEGCAEIGIIVSEHSRHVLMRNNAVYVEARDDSKQCCSGYDVVVTDDSTEGWRSDFNLFTTEEGAIGEWAGLGAATMTDWQNLSGDDPLSISPPKETVWVDPDGNDNLLGFQSAGGADGRDDNLHLLSPFGEVAQGALAPVESLTGLFPSLPKMEPVVFQSDPAPDEKDLSPGVDWGDPTYDYSRELLEHGQMINLGAYGNTDQASRSEPEYIHMLYPLGGEEWVPGRTYEIRWRSRLQPGSLLIELYHGDSNGTLQATIDPAAPDSGSYVWTVPPALVVPEAEDYVVVITWPGDAADPNDDVVGESRLQFAVRSPDSVPPTVLAVGPIVVPWEISTNADVTSIGLSLSEDIDAAGAADPGTYELLNPGPDGAYGTDDDATYALVPTYVAGTYDSDPSSVSLDITGGPLPQGEYRFTISAAGISDQAGLQLDGDGDGTGGDDYIRFFTIDTTAPTVSDPSVSPSPRNEPVEQIDVVFDEPIRELGLADLRLMRDGGANLLTGAHLLTTNDETTWTLPNLEALTEEDGHYALELFPIDSGIRDLAGNLLAGGAMVAWVMDTTVPTVEIVPVSPDPRDDGVSEINIVFSEQVGGFDMSDLALSLGGGSNLLTGAQTLTTTDNVTWTLGNLAGLTATDGIYTLRLTAEDSGIQDQLGNLLERDTKDVWTVDSMLPTVQIVSVGPDPRNSAVEQIVIALSEPILGLDLADLSLALDGGGNLLTGSQTLTSLNNIRWTLGNLGGLTDQSGDYLLSLTAAGADIRDFTGNPLAQDADEAWTMDTSLPTAGITAVDPDPQTTSVNQLSIQFSEAVTGFDLADLSLVVDGGENLLTGAETLTSGDNVTWVLGNLSGVTTSSGTYDLTLAAAGSSIQDAAGNPLAADAAENWNQDLDPPSVDIVDVTPDPRTAGVGQIEFVFSEPVEGLDLDDLLLVRNHGGNRMPGEATLSTLDNVTWTLDNLGELTDLAGRYGLALVAHQSAITDVAGNPLPTGATETWILQRPTQVVDRHIFYNNSAFDGGPDADDTDDNSIAPDKTALLPDRTATFANYTSYSHGINGIMIDVTGIPDTENFDDNDFEFMVSNNNDPTTWTPAPEPENVTVREVDLDGDQITDVDRVSIIWLDKLIQNQWLKVTMLSTVNTGLEQDDVFYFGNAIGESGNSDTDAKVNAIDLLLARNNPHNLINEAPLTSRYDFNRDRRVNATDMLIARENQTNLLNALKLITAAETKGTKSSPEIDWLFEFEQSRQPPEKTDQTEEATDILLQMWPS